jgi:hypothetical protein
MFFFDFPWFVSTIGVSRGNKTEGSSRATQGVYHALIKPKISRLSSDDLLILWHETSAVDESLVNQQGKIQQLSPPTGDRGLGSRHRVFAASCQRPGYSHHSHRPNEGFGPADGLSASLLAEGIGATSGWLQSNFLAILQRSVQERTLKPRSLCNGPWILRVRKPLCRT